MTVFDSNNGEITDNKGEKDANKAACLVVELSVKELTVMILPHVLTDFLLWAHH